MERENKNWLLWAGLIALHTYGMIHGVAVYNILGKLGVFIGASMVIILSFFGVLIVNKLERKK